MQGAEFLNTTGDLILVSDPIENRAQFIEQALQCCPTDRAYPVDHFIEDPRMIEQQLGEVTAATKEVDKDATRLRSIGELLVEDGGSPERLYTLDKHQCRLIRIRGRLDGIEQHRKQCGQIVTRPR